DSDYVAFGAGPDRGLLWARLATDPRAKLLHSGQDVLFRLEPNANGAFVLDWRVAPSEAAIPAPRGAARAWKELPPPAGARARAFEGYVDAARISKEGCVALTHLLDAAAPSLTTYELASAGPATAFLDDQWIATAGASDAVLGRGVTFPARLDPGPHEL